MMPWSKYRVTKPSLFKAAVFQEKRPLDEDVIDWYREHYPEMVMEAWCTRGSSGPGGM